jgi:hypothetical protein
MHAATNFFNQSAKQLMINDVNRFHKFSKNSQTGPEISKISQLFNYQTYSTT